MHRVEVVIPNFKRRLSGITSTLERVLPVQAATLGIAVLGTPLKAVDTDIGLADLPGLWRRPDGRPFRVFHARRNNEMLGGLVLRDLLRMPLRLVFTSASQRHHTRWSRFLIARMDAVISTSEATAGYLERPSTVVMHGIDVRQFRPADDVAEARRALGLPNLRLVGSLGRIRAQKGTDVFVDAMIEVLAERPDVGAVVLGRATGQHQRFLQDQKTKVEAAGLAHRFLFPGEVAAHETAAWYRALDVFIAPQRWEGFGVTVLEAMATGVPVVATAVGAFPQLVPEGSVGNIVPPGEVAPMAEAAAAWLDSEARRRAAGRAARRHAETMSIEAEAASIAGVYDELWAAGRGAPSEATKAPASRSANRS